MALKKKPVTGMKDILPAEMQIRDYVLNQIKETYRGFGFSAIETPCVEHIENLLSKQGGDNEKLIFKILKRGEKLNIETAETENDLADGGLRYDLTLPLSRYYSNNSANLPSPFKALQVGSVWRADRPQKGRFRQFVQCDIDILGDATNQAEIELILATTTALKKICPDNSFEVRVNDRKLLRAMAVYSGFPEEDIDKVFITVDKMDKIGTDGVKAELMENGYVAGRPAIGISYDTLPLAFRIYYNLPEGVYISAVYDGSDAQAKGVTAGDIITAVNGTRVTSIDELNRVKNQFTAGQTITLTIYHGGVSSDVEIILMDRANA